MCLKSPATINRRYNASIGRSRRQPREKRKYQDLEDRLARNPGPEINNRVLRHREIRVIDEDGGQLGIMLSRAALNLAREQGLDLVMVSPSAQPPVCRIIDYGKHKYNESKLGNDKKSKQQEVKGIKISPRIAEHDLEVGVRKATQFLEEGDKVKVTCMFRAREVTHPELGQQRLAKFLEMVSEIATSERTPTLDGRMMIMVLLPKPGVAKKKDAKIRTNKTAAKRFKITGTGKITRGSRTTTTSSCTRERLGRGGLSLSRWCSRASRSACAVYSCWAR